jgi:VanZ family protein
LIAGLSMGAILAYAAKEMKRNPVKAHQIVLSVCTLLAIVMGIVSL